MITLDQLKADIATLQKKVAIFEAQPAPLTYPLTIEQPHLHTGEIHVGTIITPDGSRRHHLILLPDKTTDDLNWQAAKDWAARVGGELPDRVESALLFAMRKDQFDERWYWTREIHAGNDSYAWCQGFSGGDQNDYPRYGELPARAVRRLPI